MTECPDCERQFTGAACPRCGWKVPITAAPRAPASAATCPVDGARLQADGFCPVGSGYRVDMACPFVCPHCRRPLSWDGGCLSCFGTTTGKREDWTFPGHRYALLSTCPNCRTDFDGRQCPTCAHRAPDSSGHWVRVAGLAPGRPACTDAENAAGIAAVQAALAAAPPLAKRAPR